MKLHWMTAGLILLAAGVVPSVIASAEADTGGEPAAASASPPAVAADGALDLSPYRGKVVYLDFWASWCKPCLQSMPWLNEMQAKYAQQGLVVIGINVDRKESAVEAFLEKTPLDFEIIRDPQGQLARAYEIEAMPSSFVYGRDGALVKRTLGFHPKETEAMEAMILELLEQKPSGGSPASDVKSAAQQ